jgi:hypothetical protein
MRSVFQVLPLCVALAVAGCATKNNGPLIPDANSPISDVPVPAGFTLGENSTAKTVTAKSLRIVDHHYEGSDDFYDVIAFYKAQMPKNNWTSVGSSEPTGKEFTLHFTKGSEDCFVTVAKKTFNTEIRIRIDPLSTTTAP